VSKECCARYARCACCACCTRYARCACDAERGQEPQLDAMHMYSNVAVLFVWLPATSCCCVWFSLLAATLNVCGVCVLVTSPSPSPSPFGCVCLPVMPGVLLRVWSVASTTMPFQMAGAQCRAAQPACSGGEFVCKPNVLLSASVLYHTTGFQDPSTCTVLHCAALHCID
jgi:hypothetical protein